MTREADGRTDATSDARVAQEIISYCHRKRLDRHSVHLFAYLLCAARDERRFRFTMDPRGPYSDELDIAIDNAFYLGMIGVESEISGREIRSFLVSRPRSLAGKEVGALRSLVSTALELDAQSLGLAATGAFISKAIERIDKSQRWNIIGSSRMSSRVKAAINEYRELYGAVESADRVSGLPTPADVSSELEQELPFR